MPAIPYQDGCLDDISCDDEPSEEAGEDVSFMGIVINSPSQVARLMMASLFSSAMSRVRSLFSLTTEDKHSSNKNMNVNAGNGTTTPKTTIAQNNPSNNNHTFSFTKQYMTRAGKWSRRLSFGRLRLTHLATILSTLAKVELETRSLPSSPDPTGFKKFIYCNCFGTLMHEIGHAVVMVMLDIKFYPIVLVPFYGAFVARRESPKHEALIALGGPLLGMAAAAWLGVLGHFVFHDKNGILPPVVLITACRSLFSTNLGNLVPWTAFDGHHILQVISPALSFAATVYFISKLSSNNGEMSEFECVLMMYGIKENIYRMFFKEDNDSVEESVRGRPPLYFSISWADRIRLMAFYVAVVVFGSLCYYMLTKYPKQGQTLVVVMAVGWTFVYVGLLAYVRGLWRSRNTGCYILETRDDEEDVSENDHDSDGETKREASLKPKSDLQLPHDGNASKTKCD